MAEAEAMVVEGMEEEATVEEPTEATGAEAIRTEATGTAITGTAITGMVITGMEAGTDRGLAGELGSVPAGMAGVAATGAGAATGGVSHTAIMMTIQRTATTISLGPPGTRPSIRVPMIAMRPATKQES